MMAFIGPAGTGKSAAAHGMVFGYQYHNFQKKTFGAELVEWANLSSLRLMVGSYNGPRADKAEQDLNRLANLGLLVIDEFATSRVNDCQLDQIHCLINRRYNRCRSTVIATTRSVQELEEIMGGGIVDRFTGGRTGGKLVEFNGKNWRQDS